jgi:hypothetical protein
MRFMLPLENLLQYSSEHRPTSQLAHKHLKQNTLHPLSLVSNYKIKHFSLTSLPSPTSNPRFITFYETMVGLSFYLSQNSILEKCLIFFFKMPFISFGVPETFILSSVIVHAFSLKFCVSNRQNDGSRNFY